MFPLNLFTLGRIILAWVIAHKEVKSVKHIAVSSEEVLLIVPAVTSFLARMLHKVAVKPYAEAIVEIRHQYNVTFPFLDAQSIGRPSNGGYMTPHLSHFMQSSILSIYFIFSSMVLN